MLAELAAANAAFSVIKSFISNGKELTGCAKHISDFVFAKEAIQKKANKKIQKKESYKDGGKVESLFNFPTTKSRE